jgi:glycosyltransferase involved in cell wall biosynthesis
MPWVSVIIPVYNRYTFLEQAVSSVLEQSYRDFELIIIDDGSDVAVSETAIAGCDPRVSIIRLDQNCGVAAARNAGVRVSNGHWIAFLDSDDLWHRHKLQKQLRWLDLNSEMTIMQTREIWIRNGVRVNPPRSHEKIQGDLFKQSLDRCMITPSSVILSRSLFDSSGGFNESLRACEDYDLWLRICCKHNAGLLDEYLLTRYGGHDDQLSGTVEHLDKYRVRSILQLLESAELNPVQYNQAVAVLVKKARILANGYYKRGNSELYKRYQSIVARYGTVSYQYNHISDNRD